ncbi:sigma-54-dependent Fis family transcriptional regulator [Alcaligenes sp. A-TC2]|uniref:sigma-54-dependent Fis family transcriptional regulator n=1 Tax=Alcaligenes TaxID=507 RepID=UPI0002AA7A4E|nr:MULTISPECIES: sigma-54-dependent Fis family transcriptional regulator [Alcaligenes]EKU30594.1 acetoin catabolism regulatory protein [Alcaligenes sp. HPC1271]ERT54811.1 ATPase AAA [Alcaligenes sp. EGD-AK7]MCX5472158.1 sigma-54-dependent Fis family transcriptional regulator [Alcaligenes nematophilus]HRO20249.1 sigma-54-dependent Fis family transcriptional regulator [Alcaligenes phenolicus]HRP13944.1 sigma-54-dependent Fis family transcriptional regulator [Alcaligenes phenolicus]
MQSSHVAHVQEITAVWQGSLSRRDQAVVHSWRRCIEHHRLDPAQACEAYIVPDSQLREHRQQSEALINIARSGLERLYQQVSGLNYVLLLSDNKGVTVDFLGSDGQRDALRQAGLYMGSEWSEERAGTCAVGTCLHTGEALTIHQNDHFDHMHAPLSCTAAPIYHYDGELAAVLDLSLLQSPQAKASQGLALHLANAATRRIELANLMACHRQEWILCLSQSPEFLDIDPEAAIAIDGSGRIKGMTHTGARILARAAGVDWRNPAGLLGQSLMRFLHLEVDQLPTLMRYRPTQERVVMARDGSVLFAHAIEPRRVLSNRSVGMDGAAVDAALPQALRGLAGTDAAMQSMLLKAARLATREMPVLLQGETGSGKEYLARAIHTASGRGGNFVAVNCAALPESLIESELFGYLAGTYTGGAARGRTGLIEAADGGTLFLDEIGDMPLALQSRLLRVLAESEVMPLGARTGKRVDLRVISASHHDLSALVEQGRFRADLLYRLNAAVLALPALRQRSDLEWLVQQILHRRNKGDVPGLSPEAWQALQAYEWPGNLRELDNALVLALALAEGSCIEVQDLPEALRERRLATSTGSPTAAAVSAGESSWQQVLQACGDNVSAAARQLGISRSTLHRYIKRAGVARQESPSDTGCDT